MSLSVSFFDNNYNLQFFFHVSCTNHNTVIKFHRRSPFDFSFVPLDLKSVSDKYPRSNPSILSNMLLYLIYIPIYYY